MVPFDVTPPAWLDPKPAIEQANFVTWEEPNLPAVRILAPESIYRPGDPKESAVPNDYLGYLLGQTKVGAHFSDQTNATVAGQTATIITATTDTSMDGSLGCPAKGTLAPACFGLQPELQLRIAVLQVHDRTILIWLRTDKAMKAADVAAKVASFNDLLAGIRFSSRPVQTATTPSGTPLDGTYQMSVSWPKVNSAGARCVGGPEGTSPQVLYELDLDHGSLVVWVQVGGPAAKREVGLADNYRIDGHRISFGDASFEYALIGHALTLSKMQGGDCGGGAIFMTKPWIRK
ncbi:hypothetical protein FHX52_4348 [Humibacillus xanthopallidus]|uniref:Uncharacterized protein n=1 Tax=Humibacillus xanthopallidus TaxID=412689 RepID=A0A543PM26_9MICO|nr:hypothetical protein FHX52_4348 [Humibacillus xanthopallidus]